MWTNIRAAWLRFYHKQSSIYPVRWYWPIIRIFGGSETAANSSVYMTRVELTRPTRWGQLYLHVFHREDLDRDPHDHPFEFWTLPFNIGYIEEVFDAIGKCFGTRHVPARRWSYRPATHIHRVIATESGRWPLVTLVWRGHHQQPWGFWCHSKAQSFKDPERFKIPYREYSHNGTGVSHANVAGQDDVCPSGGPRT